ncbi:MAG: hypothetical protein R3D68_05165 [Hyphomicrobiaceae bacterium]
MNGAQALKSGFARDVLATFGTKMAAAGVGLLTSVLVARSLGPDGRGAFATVMTLAAIGMQFANLGLRIRPIAITWPATGRSATAVVAEFPWRLRWYWARWPECS